MTQVTSNEHEQHFPFEEIRQESGDYFDYIWQLRDLGYADTQIWTVTVHDDTWCWGPSHHWVNPIGYVATKEHHDNNTYYFEEVPEPDC